MCDIKIKNKNVLYITYIDIRRGNTSSGSSVRPKRIYECFLERRYNVTLLEGSQLKEKKKERLHNIKQIEQLIDKTNFEYCYIELPTMPITFRKDLQLIKLIKNKGIKIGAFYRDFYWKYPEVWKVTAIRRIYYTFKYKYQLNIFKKYIDVIFFPTKKSIENFKSFESMKDVCMLELPPGMDIVSEIHNDIYKNIIYVGGISTMYRIELFLEAIKQLNEDGMYINFTLVCREEELQAEKEVLSKYFNEQWLKIVHTSNKNKLTQLYAKSDLGVSTLVRNDYTNMCMPIKLGEYLSHGIPLIATACDEIKKFIGSNQCGFICDDNVEDIKRQIKKIYENKEVLKEAQQNIYKTIEANTWNSRIDILERGLGVDK